MALEDKCTLESKVGEGSFSNVYQAQCRKTGAANAVKIIDSLALKFGRPTTEVGILKK